MPGMVRKISITLPEELARVLDGVDNASAYIAESIRLRTRREDFREFLAGQGIHVTDEGVARAGARLAAAEALRDAARAQQPRRDYGTDRRAA